MPSYISTASEQCFLCNRAVNWTTSHMHPICYCPYCLEGSARHNLSWWRRVLRRLW